MVAPTIATFFRKVFAGKRVSKRSAITDDRYFPLTDWGALLNPTSAGIDVTPETAKRFSALFACIKIPSETLGSIPIFGYKRLPNRGKEIIPEDRIYKLLRLRPNRWQTSAMFRQQMFAHALSWGNGFARIRRDRAGLPNELQPIHPSLVETKVAYGVEGLPDGTVYYKVATPSGATEIVRKRDMFHLVGITDDGITGYSPIAALRESVGLGVAAETFGASFFGNGATPAAVIEYEGVIGENEREAFRQSINKLYKGPRKAGQVAILDQKMKWKPIGIPVKDAQYIELRRFQVEEIARVYRVPLYKLQDHTHSTFSNVEHLAIEFVTDCLLPWAKRFEEAVLRDLFNDEATIEEYSDERFVEFLFDGLLRGDIQTRYGAYATARQWGWLSINDIRRFENMNPIGPDGDIYLTPLNMIPAGEEDAQLKALMKGKDEPAKKPKQPDAEEEPAKEPQADDGERGRAEAARVRQCFRGAMREAWQRAVRKEIGSVRTAARKKDTKFLEWFDEFTAAQRDFARECIEQIYRSYAGVAGVEESSATAGLLLTLEGYSAEVAEAVGRFWDKPEAGYERDEAKVSEHWSEQLLSVHDGRAMVTKEAA